MKTVIHRASGFTLIEVIVTLVVAAIALVAIIPFLGEVFLRSLEPRIQLRAAMDLQTAMENLVASHTNGLALLQQQVGPENSLFQGRFAVVDNRYIAFVGMTETAMTGNTNLLKITLANDLGETVTRLFTVPL